MLALTRNPALLQGTSVDGDPYAAHLRIKLVPATTAIQAQVGCCKCSLPACLPSCLPAPLPLPPLAPSGELPPQTAADCWCLPPTIPANAGWGHARRHSPAALQVFLELADYRQACLRTLSHTLHWLPIRPL